MECWIILINVLKNEENNNGENEGNGENEENEGKSFYMVNNKTVVGEPKWQEKHSKRRVQPEVRHRRVEVFTRLRKAGESLKRKQVLLRRKR